MAEREISAASMRSSKPKPMSRSCGYPPRRGVVQVISAVATPFESILALRLLGLNEQQIASDQEVQQLIYLLSRAGAEFSYRYKWEVFGPYSVELAAELGEWPLSTQDIDVEPSDATAKAIEQVKKILEPPESVGFDRPVWLRLLMCVDFASTRAHLELSNGDRPQFLSRNFELEDITIARSALAVLS
jgi:hypothetical protein